MALMAIVNDEELENVSGGAGGYMAYPVKKDDTLSQIAFKFHTDVYTLKRLNNIKDVDKINVNQVLLIPRGN